ncbi:hypothetical protein DL95DRAFT_418589 [Leptodontidium sp. 2 PMI_412]|nr:hypothetical protein DL95DRAFT_418589 [Leptodontidium sp. 2 PMI_412]
MRLINVKTFKLEEFLDYKTPSYAILSHTWGSDYEELTFRDIESGEIDKPGLGSVKFRGCCRQAMEDGFGYAWIDTCCIDKANLVELSEPRPYPKVRESKLSPESELSPLDLYGNPHQKSRRDFPPQKRYQKVSQKHV